MPSKESETARWVLKAVAMATLDKAIKARPVNVSCSQQAPALRIVTERSMVADIIENYITTQRRKLDRLHPTSPNANVEHAQVLVLRAVQAAAVSVREVQAMIKKKTKTRKKKIAIEPKLRCPHCGQGLKYSKTGTFSKKVSLTIEGLELLLSDPRASDLTVMLTEKLVKKLMQEMDRLLAEEPL